MTQPKRRVLVTGARGFIGKNLAVRLGELPNFSVLPFTRDDDPATLPELVAQADAVVHLAGENRPSDESVFSEVNVGLTIALCDAVRREVDASGRTVPVILASSIQAERDTAYGRSKRQAEQVVEELTQQTGNPSVIFRLPGVFGKWCRPNYNSVVATFCHNIARDLPIRIDDPDAVLRLVYIDDVISALVRALDRVDASSAMGAVSPQYEITLGALAEQIQTFRDGRENLRVERVGTGLARALYATYVSGLPVDRFSYPVTQHADPRGTFVEMLKTPDCGQFSFLTAAPGVTRGGHYHHSKVEKFLVVRGEARFRFRHLLTDERVELQTSGVTSQVIETIPGWAHDITNIGDEELIVIVWANEIFDHDRPDTFPSEL